MTDALIKTGRPDTSCARTCYVGWYCSSAFIVVSVFVVAYPTVMTDIQMVMQTCRIVFVNWNMICKSWESFTSHTPRSTVLFLDAFANRKKRRLASSCPSVCPHVSARLPQDGFPWNFMMGTSIKICRETPNFVKIEQKYWALYMKT